MCYSKKYVFIYLVNGFVKHILQGISQCFPWSVTFISIEHELWLGLKATTLKGEVDSSRER